MKNRFIRFVAFGAVALTAVGVLADVSERRPATQMAALEQTAR